MQLNGKIIGQVCIVTIGEPKLDTAIANEMKTQVLGLITAGPPHLLINMSAVSMVDSSALGIFAIIYKACKAQGEFALCEINKNVQTLLRMTKLDQVFRCFETEDEAITALNNPVPAAQSAGE